MERSVEHSFVTGAARTGALPNERLAEGAEPLRNDRLRAAETGRNRPGAAKSVLIGTKLSEPARDIEALRKAWLFIHPANLQDQISKPSMSRICAESWMPKQ